MNKLYSEIPILNAPDDALPREAMLNPRSFSIKIRDRKEWQIDISKNIDDGIVAFTDGSRINSETGCGGFITDRRNDERY